MSELHVRVEHEGEQYCTSRNASKFAGVAIQTIYNWMDTGKVKGLRIRHFRFVEIESLRKACEPKPVEPV